MTAFISPPPRLQFFTNAGVPMASGLLYTYAAGTTTPLTTYTDSTGLVANTNPVILDSRGEASIWLSTVGYKFKLATPANVDIWTQDNITAYQVSSNLISYTPAGTGAVVTTVQAKLREGLSVKDFGATGDGVTDDTVAIQLAFTSAAALTPKKTVYFPAGTYVINPSTTIDATGCSIDGDGQSVSIIKPSVLSTAAVAGWQHITYNTDSNFTVSNIQIDLTNVTYTGVYPSLQRSYHMLCYNCTNWAIRNCSFTGISNNKIGVYANGGNYWEITDCYFENLVPSIQYSQAINIQQYSGTHRVLNNVMNGTGLFSNSGDGLVSHNVAYNISFGAGLCFGPFVDCKNNIITNNHLTGGFGSPDVNSTYTHGIENWGSDSIITGNYCSNNSGSGITHGGYRGVVSGNICLNNGIGGTGLNGITAYSVLAPITTSASNSVITGNLCSDTQAVKTQAYGYREVGAGTIVNMLVHSNYFYDNLTGDQLTAQTTPQVLRSSSPAWMPNMSVGAATPTTNVNLLSNSYLSLTGTDASAMRMIDQFPTTATVGNRGLNIQLNTAAAVTSANSIFINNFSTVGAGAITTQYGIFIQDLTTGTNIRGIQSSVSAGANKYNINVTGTAPSYFAGEIQVAGGTVPMLHSIAGMTTGAGASVGTLNNAPAAGNPTKWIAFNDGGVTRYIPAW
jgi:hypothetical protein